MIDPAQVERLRKALHLETPLVAVYDTAPHQDFDPSVVARGRVCCFAFYDRWMNGETLIIEKGTGEFGTPDAGCHGSQVAFGLKKGYPDFMANFLTDGKGAPMGEGLKETPALAQEFLDRAKAPELKGNTILIGPLRPDRWDAVRSVTFFVDPDRLAGAMTLATYFSSPDDYVRGPFSSGCGLMLRELESQEKDSAILGTTDLAMRKYLPPEILALTVTPARFEKMLSFPDDSFLFRNWWNDLMKSRN